MLCAVDANRWECTLLSFLSNYQRHLLYIVSRFGISLTKKTTCNPQKIYHNTHIKCTDMCRHANIKACKIRKIQQILRCLCLPRGWSSSIYNSLHSTRSEKYGCPSTWQPIRHTNGHILHDFAVHVCFRMHFMPIPFDGVPRKFYTR